MKTITYKNLKDVKTGKPLTIEVPDDFNMYSDDAAYATLAGRRNGKRFRRAFRKSNAG